MPDGCARVDGRQQTHLHDIIVVGASTGGVEALAEIVHRLPKDLPAAIFVVLHLPAERPSRLPEILSRYCRLPVAQAQDGEPIRCGRVYVAPPDRHLLVDREVVRVARGPKENRSRPAVDPLFRTAASSYGSRVVGVVLTGAMDDGTAGLRAIKRRGGIAVVQDPREALIPSMPESALRYIQVDHTLALKEIARLLSELAWEPAPDESQFPVAHDIEVESKMAGEDGMVPEPPPGTISAFTCPECTGPLWELRDGDLVRFRCRTGHAFTADSLLSGQSEEVEEALWTAINTLRESAQMARRLMAEAQERGHQHVAARLEARARNHERQAELVSSLLRTGNDDVPEDDETAAEQAERIS
jgi:two-component system, chemotaxis family, protein-glutamate methylesterase/glutaminase